MDSFGIEINTLVLRGGKKEDAILSFKMGLNIIAGASDTGKSFAFECMNYIFGSTDIPDMPNEANGYESVLLELTERNSQQKVTLKRSLSESDKNNIYYIYSDIEGMLEANYTILSNDSKAKNSLSSKLLSLCNCSYKNVLRKSANGETEAFTFRKFIYLTMLSETRIVQKNSSIYLGDTRRDRTSTKETATFFTVLSGIDYQKHVKVESVDVKKAQLKGAIDELSLICNELRIEIAESENLIKEINADEINRQITKLYDTLKEQRVIFKEKEDERRHSFDKLNSLANEKSRITDNLLKFRLLKKNYQSDIDRLDFIAQSHNYTEQLANIKCPICNTDMKTSVMDKEIYYIAIDKEKEKLSIHLTDLQGTIEDFEIDLSEINKSIDDAQNNVRYIENILESQANKISETLSDYEEYLKMRDKVIEVRNDKQKLFITSNRIQELTEKIDNTKSIATKSEIIRLSDELMLDFCDIIQDLLERWVFIEKSEIKQVVFDEKSNDVFVCKKSKASYGKGARAIINSAFILSIMRYCIERGLSHPGFVVLDSPLTTYKEKDRKENAMNEDVDKSVKDSFYSILSKESEKYQIFVFDNELPPRDLENITYHHFTGNPEIARMGFIPS